MCGPLSQLFTLSDFERPSSHPVIVWLISVLLFTPLHLRLSVSSSLVLNTFSFFFLIGCRSANSWTWLNGLALSVSRQMGCRLFLNTEKKKGTEKEACV